RWLQLPITECLLYLFPVTTEVVNGLFTLKLQVIWIVRLDDLNSSGKVVVLGVRVHYSDSASYWVWCCRRATIRVWSGIPVLVIKDAPGHPSTYPIEGVPKKSTGFVCCAGEITANAV